LKLTGCQARDYPTGRPEHLECPRDLCGCVQLTQ
ncbi:hypothetical protein T12_9322, partial [Trichinella patagoniensis]